jgi:CDP-glucose 4,6-dehydratase
VLEPLRGYLDLAERLLNKEQEFASAWNFGPAEQDARPVEWIVAQLSNLWPVPVSCSLDKEAQVHEATYLKLDCSKAHSLLGWHPALNLNSALRLIVEWSLAWQSGADMQGFTLAQIAAYQELASSI